MHCKLSKSNSMLHGDHVMRAAQWSMAKRKVSMASFLLQMLCVWMLLAAVQSQQESEQLGPHATQATPEPESADLLAPAAKGTELDNTSVLVPESGATLLPPTPSDFAAGVDAPAASAGSADATQPTDTQQPGATARSRLKRAARRRHPPTNTAGNGPSSEAVAEATAAAVPAAITWNGDVGTGCDFKNQDMKSTAAANGSLCQTRCASTTGCTHFVWTRFNRGTCFLKNGSRSKADAIASGDSTMVCGLVIKWNGKNWAGGCDFLGRDLQQVKVRSDQCGTSCINTRSCTHYTWTKVNGGTCFMKQGAVSKLNASVNGDSTTVCGVVVNWNSRSWANACDFQGRDLQQANVRAEQCGPTCNSTRSCTHYAWTTFNGGTCFMKQGTVTKLDAIVTTDSSMLCGMVEVNWNGRNWANACDFLGRDLQQQSNVRNDQCGPLCASTASCTHYTWTTINGGTCFMKQGAISKLDAFVTTDSTMVCGVVVIWNGNWANGCDFLGRDLQQASVRADQCGPTCASTTSCTHYSWTTFNGGTCFMKQGVVSKTDAIATTDSTMVCGVRDSTPGELLFLDDFTKLNQDLWNIDLGDGTDYGIPGWGNNELQCYTGNSNNLAIIPNPERQGDGLLKIRSVYSSTSQNCINKYAEPTSRQWTSAKITTSGKRTFTPKPQTGVCFTVSMESRIKLANKRGHWEAFWSLGVSGNWPSCGEIDIMEHINLASSVLGTIHYANPAGGHQQLPNINVIPLPDGAQYGWNVYRVDWSCDSITYYVNNEKKYAIPKSQVNVWSFDQPFFLLLNMAVGGNLPGFDVDTAGGEMLVDYIKVYRT